MYIYIYIYIYTCVCIYIYIYIYDIYVILSGDAYSTACSKRTPSNLPGTSNLVALAAGGAERAAIHDYHIFADYYDCCYYYDYYYYY